MKAKSKRDKKIETKKIDTFLSGADYKNPEDEDFNFPWENPNIDKKKTRKLTVRIPEEYALKLDYLNENSIPKIMKQRFILESMIPLIDDKIKKFTDK